MQFAGVGRQTPFAWALENYPEIVLGGPIRPLGGYPGSGQDARLGVNERRDLPNRLLGREAEEVHHQPDLVQPRTEARVTRVVR